MCIRDRFNNLLKLGSLKRKKGGEKDIALTPDDISVYLFRRCKRANGFEIVPVEVTRNGLNTEHFAEVLREMNNEYVDYEERAEEEGQL